jgi:hypothetical protein
MTIGHNDVQIEHLDGHKVTLAASGVTQPGQVVLIKGEGMPVYESVRCLARTSVFSALLLAFRSCSAAPSAAA